ncbi:pilus assembly protein CpaE [Babesia caballi]|uniref:Pilus assembly protein CpaE n=1 Tax=Babesia caballi TaxID=5871 RepID=A0AAV4LSJ0_BABCB|nr:pilus assembly protein CpaE [Babesia caballi]
MWKAATLEGIRRREAGDKASRYYVEVETGRSLVRNRLQNLEGLERAALVEELVRTVDGKTVDALLEDALQRAALQRVLRGVRALVARVVLGAPREVGAEVEAELVEGDALAQVQTPEVVQLAQHEVLLAVVGDVEVATGKVVLENGVLEAGEEDLVEPPGGPVDARGGDLPHHAVAALDDGAPHAAESGRQVRQQPLPEPHVKAEPPGALQRLGRRR